MIHNIEDKTKKELVEIVKIQMEEYEKLLKAEKQTSAMLDEALDALKAAERELENERMMSMKRFVETGRAERFAIQQKIEVIGEATKYCISKFPNGAIHSLGEFANQLRQQINGDNQ